MLVIVTILGPFKTPFHQLGYTAWYFLSVIDRATGWTSLPPLVNIEPGTIISNLLTYWIVNKEVPLIITADQGRQFISTTWQDFCGNWGIHHYLTSAYHYQSSGKIERFHRTLADSLRSKIDGSDDLYSNLHTTLLGLHNALGPRGFSASMYTYGRQLSLPNFISTSKEQHREIRNMHAKELMRVFTSISYPETTWDQPPSHLLKNLEAVERYF